MQWGIKNLVNQTGGDLAIVLTPRVGDDPTSTGDPISVTVPASAAQGVTYGNDQNPYLSGVNASLQLPDGSYLEAEQFVTVRGCVVDDRFNRNDTLTFTIADTNLHVTGSNSP